MADREVIGWFTVNGHHIPIYEGQSRDEAWKEQQIRWSKKDAERMQRGEITKPRRIILKDIPAEKANEDPRGILDLATKNRFKFKDGTKIKFVEVFAGYGTEKEFRDAAKYAARYGGKPQDWQHVAGEGIIVRKDGTGQPRKVEVHWVQHRKGGIKEAFIKVRH